MRALQIYIPQYRASHNFKNIKKIAGIKNIRARDINLVLNAAIYNKETNEFEYYKNVGNLNSKEYNEVLENYRNMSIISFNELPKYPKQIMLLSTCSYHTSEGRFVVAAYRIV